MAYICLDCGHIFEDGEQAIWEESRGEFWGIPCTEKMDGCPLCHGCYEKSVPCKICGSEHLRDELSGGVCDGCIEKYQHNIDICFAISKNDTESVELNRFLVSMFDKSEIEEILFRELKEAQKCKTLNCIPFIDGDRDWFGEELAKEVNKNENKEN